VKCCDCSISEISDGASRVMPDICSLLPARCSSVTKVLSGRTWVNASSTIHARRRVIFAPFQRRDRRAVAVVARPNRRALRRNLPRKLGFLRAKTVADIGRRHHRQQGDDNGDAERDRERPAQPRGVEVASRLLLEYLDAARITLGDIGADGDGGGMEGGHRLHISHRNLARGRRDYRGDACRRRSRQARCSRIRLRSRSMASGGRSARAR